MNIDRTIGMLAIAAAVLLGSCSLDTGSELSEYEEEFLAEQAASSMSSDEGGAVYTVEQLSDPEYYQELEDNPNIDYDAATGKFTVSLSVSLPNSDGDASTEIEYSLYDAGGNIQSSFNPLTTRKAVATMKLVSSIETLRYTADVTLDSSITVEGLNTSTVTVNGSSSGERSSWTTENAQRSSSSTITYEAELYNLTLEYDSSYGGFLLTGGTSSTNLNGNVNDKTFSRTADWVFGSGNTATMTYQGEQLTVDLETGTIQ